MVSKNVENILKTCFKGDDWSIVSADAHFRKLAAEVVTLDDLERVTTYGGELIAKHDMARFRIGVTR